jgi:beta-N-acetylhexosaminidase
VKLLRGMGFEGVVMAGDLPDAATAAGEPVPQAAVDALRAGDDLLMLSGTANDQEAAVRAVMTAVQRGDVSRARLRESLLRTLELKRRYGLIKGR